MRCLKQDTIKLELKKYILFLPLPVTIEIIKKTNKLKNIYQNILHIIGSLK